MPDLSKQFRTKEKKKHKAGPATYRLIDGARWHISPEAIEKIKQMRKEEDDKKRAALDMRRGRSTS